MCVCVWCMLVRYWRGTEERGIILGSVDEINLTLEDNTMNLQSMAASRFVQPFFDRVQKWEKSLSHISEVVDVRRAFCGIHTYIFVALNLRCVHLHTACMYVCTSIRTVCTHMPAQRWLH